MSQHTGNKLICDIPQEIIFKTNDFLASSTDFKNLSSMLNSYFHFYLASYENLTASNILLYDNLPNKKRNNFSFYLSDTNFQRLKLLSQSNLRSVKDQATHFVYSIYKYIISEETIYWWFFLYICVIINDTNMITTTPNTRANYKKINVNVSTEIKSFFTRQAESTGLSLSSFVNSKIEAYIKNKGFTQIPDRHLEAYVNMDYDINTIAFYVTNSVYNDLNKLAKSKLSCVKKISTHYVFSYYYSLTHNVNLF